MTEFVASFLGASTLLDGELKEQRDRHTTGAPGGREHGQVAVGPCALRLGGAVSRRGRPEKITIALDGGPGWNSVSELLRMSTYIGVSHQYKVKGPLGAPLTVWVQTSERVPARQPWDRVRLS